MLRDRQDTDRLAAGRDRAPGPRRVELLAPAGSREAFAGAISAGADAVYLGGERFGARAYADNFTTEEIVRAIGEAHVLSRKVYLTANVLTREAEMPELVAFVHTLYEAGLDGAIVQDLGVLAALHEACPDLPLHASTQLSVTSAESVRYLRRLGVCRVVPARELSLKEIRALRREDALAPGQAPAGLPEGAAGGETPAGESIEIEAFIHGAMCYAYSGRCLMSSFLGGRSGNRGRCAGPCRLPYRILDGKGRPAGQDAGKREVYPLSMKDLCVLSILPELIEAGISSFKIEGRMKQPVYAAGVTEVYRRYIDRYYAWAAAGKPHPWKVEEEDLLRLRSLYIRTSLGTGYYHAGNGRNLVTIGKPGYAGTDAALEDEIRRAHLSGLPKREVTGRAVFRIGEPARLLVEAAGGLRASAEGQTVQEASGRPLEAEAIRARLQKTGDSMFTFSSLEVEADDNVFLPVSAVNALRRDALLRLQELCAGRRKMPCSGRGQTGEEGAGPAGQPAHALGLGIPAPVTYGAKAQGTAAISSQGGEATAGAAMPGTLGQELWALVSTSAQMEAAVEAGCACVIADGDLSPSSGGRPAPEKVQFICALPPVFRVSYRERVREQIRTAAERGFSGILVRTLEELELAREAGFGGEIIADASLYAWNGRSMAMLLRDCGRIVAPLELEQAGIRQALLAGASLLAGAGPAGEKGTPVKGQPAAGSAAAEPSREGRGSRAADRLILPVYGRIPMMESAGCVRRTEGLCAGKAGRGAGEDAFWYLEDRMGKRLPVRCRCGICANTVYNAVPLSLHQFAGRGLMREAHALLCMFTTETGAQTGEILSFFTAPGRGGQAPLREFTRGHFRTGAL